MASLLDLAVQRSCAVCATQLDIAAGVDIKDTFLGEREDPQSPFYANVTPVILLMGGSFCPPHANHARVMAAARRELERSQRTYVRPEHQQKQSQFTPATTGSQEKTESSDAKNDTNSNRKSSQRSSSLSPRNLQHDADGCERKVMQQSKYNRSGNASAKPKFRDRFSSPRSASSSPVTATHDKEHGFAVVAGFVTPSHVSAVRRKFGEERNNSGKSSPAAAAARSLPSALTAVRSSGVAGSDGVLASRDLGHIFRADSDRSSVSSDALDHRLDMCRIAFGDPRLPRDMVSSSRNSVCDHVGAAPEARDVENCPEIATDKGDGNDSNDAPRVTARRRFALHASRTIEDVSVHESISLTPPSELATKLSAWMRVDSWLVEQTANKGMSQAFSRLQLLLREALRAEYGGCRHFSWRNADERRRAADDFATRLVFFSVCGGDALPRLKTAFGTGVVCCVNRPLDYDIDEFVQRLRRDFGHKNIFLYRDDAPDLSSTRVRACLASGKPVSGEAVHPGVIALHKERGLSYGSVHSKADAGADESFATICERALARISPNEESPKAIEEAYDVAQALCDRIIHIWKVPRISSDLLSLPPPSSDVSPSTICDHSRSNQSSSHVNDLLGRGVAGSVRKRLLQRGNSDFAVAVKYIDLQLDPSAGSKVKSQRRRRRMNAEHVARECSIYSTLERHRGTDFERVNELADGDSSSYKHNILRFFGVGQDNEKLFEVIELMSCGLKEFLLVHRRRPPQTIDEFPGVFENSHVNVRFSLWGKIIRDVAHGLAFLQSATVLHRDLTIANIVLSTDNNSLAKTRAAISDFGVSKLIEDTTPIARGSCRHYAPESLSSTTFYSPKGDVFSFSYLIWEIAHGGEAVWGTQVETSEVCNRTISGLRPPFHLAPWKIVWDDKFRDIMVRCWDGAAARRPDALCLARLCDDALCALTDG